MPDHRPDWSNIALLAALPVGFALFYLAYATWSPPPGSPGTLVHQAEGLALGLVLLSLAGAGFLAAIRNMVRGRRFGTRELPSALALACAFLLASAVFLVGAYGNIRACFPSDYAAMCMLLDDARHSYALGAFAATLLAGGCGGAALVLGLQRFRQARVAGLA